MKKNIYLSKALCVFTIFLLIFTYIFSFVIQIAMPMDKTTQTSISGSLLVGLAYIGCLMAISLLAQKLALRFVKKPDFS